MFVAAIDPVENSGVGIAFTDRLGGASPEPYGPLNLGRTDHDNRAALVENFRRVRTEIAVSRIVTVHQVHSAAVFYVDDTSFPPDRPGGELGGSWPGGASLPVADAMVTTLPGVALCIRTADCVPVLFADESAGVIGAAHAGREGMARGVLAATVSAMRELGASVIRAWIGPHVCGGCYEVPADMAEEVDSVVPGSKSTTRWGTPALDLGAGCQAQLDMLDVGSTHHGGCTVENNLLHSHRRDGDAAGRLGSLIWMAGRA